ncbi:isoleucine--tRNA ligase [Peptoniphilus equinus]|uniref:Isoleucine--tRNA ligase n=1 Tax=Peptoniphilus equinus TaxID=3016343 RepID=A0ABY7QUM9_9FIRM|nr:isoleucine--tRNA ligase [Peptoniphilus equinus]WBW50481.1 isoleucine--tRNA ligase [Peptoniphilus equinus]
MKQFKPLSKEPVAQREEKISAYWDEIDLLKRSVETRDGKENFIFYEGPPTANGKPGIHHVISRTLKDLTCRYKTMSGYKVTRKAGWDTHGLPVEIEVEKKLGLHNKQDIEKYGVAAFNEKCRESVWEYESEWRRITRRMAYLIDMDDPYVTLDNNYIESVWALYNEFFKQGLIYEGHKILPYCPRCGTGLASHEVAQGYEEIKTTTVTAKFKLKGKDNEYFLAWTTTPWTLPSNVALAVNPNVDYVKVKVHDDIYYLAKDLADKVIDHEYEVLETFKGKELEYMEYEQLLDFIQPDKKAFYVVCADYVTTEDGTGIVHTAPGFGEDDYQTGRRYDLPVLKPVDEAGQFTETPWKGTFVIDADPEIIQYLIEHDLIFSKHKFMHNYPHCWRCHTPLIYYAHPSWYIEVTKLKEKLVENNKGVNWFPDFVGEKRFGNWLENLNDWAISRQRYWGTPLPIWRCDECGHTTSVGSRKELKERAIEDISEDIELHRPYVDDVHLKCDKCGHTMSRIPEVGDVWFDSGAMPFAQWHYPFEHQDDFESLFPADFICEGIDQTRGWFYSLLAIATLFKGKSPYKNVLVNDLILDKHGKKMSKSKGNTVAPLELFDKYGADVVRWYLLYVSPPWTPTKFDEDGLREVESKFFRSLRNIYNFFSLYANTDNLTPDDFDVAYEARDDIDKWLLSKYNRLLSDVEADMNAFDVTKVVRTIQNFVIEDLSNWYIRRNRRRFWKSEVDNDKRAVFATTYEVLLGLSKLIAPFVPFIAEELYENLTENESVHIEYYPRADVSKFQPEIEARMDLVRDLVALGRASRENAKIKVRQPLSKVIIDGNYKTLTSGLDELIKEELNVKAVDYEDDLSQFMNYELKPNFKVAGSILGSKIKDFSKYLQSVNAKDFVQALEAGPVSVELNGEPTDIVKDYILINIKSKPGFDVTMENNRFVILDTELTDELVNEGFVREFISKVQQMRKANDFDILDHIAVTYDVDENVAAALQASADYIKSEVLADSLEASDGGEAVDLNGHEGRIRVTKL